MWGSALRHPRVGMCAALRSSSANAACARSQSSAASGASALPSWVGVRINGNKVLVHPKASILQACEEGEWVEARDAGRGVHGEGRGAGVAAALRCEQPRHTAPRTLVSASGGTPPSYYRPARAVCGWSRAVGLSHGA